MKQKLIKVTAIFFLVMLCFTFLSRAANNFTVATVNVVEVSQQSITRTLNVEGVIEYSRMQAVVTEENQLLSDMYVREGEHVPTGKALFRVDTNELKLQIKRLQTEIDKLNLDIKDATSARTVSQEKQAREIKRAQEELEKARQTEDKELIGSSEHALEEANAPLVTDSTIEKITLDRDEKTGEMKRLEQLHEAEGLVTAPIDGTVIKLGVGVGERTGNSATILLSDSTVNPQFKGQAPLTEENQRQLHNNEGSIVIVVAKDREGKDYTVDNLIITSVVLNRDNRNQLDILIDLPDNNFNIGSMAQMTISNQTEDFDTCIPIGALRGSSGQYFVLMFEETDSILGTEYVARKVSVEVLDKNEQYAAIEAAEISNESKIIAESNKEISDGVRVKKGKTVVGNANE